MYTRARSRSRQTTKIINKRKQTKIKRKKNPTKSSARSGNPCWVPYRCPLTSPPGARQHQQQFVARRRWTPQGQVRAQKRKGKRSRLSPEPLCRVSMRRVTCATRPFLVHSGNTLFAAATVSRPLVTSRGVRGQTVLSITRRLRVRAARELVIAVIAVSGRTAANSRHRLPRGPQAEQ